MNQPAGLKSLVLLIVVISLIYTWLAPSGSELGQIQTVLMVPLECQSTDMHRFPVERSTDTVELILEGEPEVVSELREGLVRAWIEIDDLPNGVGTSKVKVLCPDNVKIIKVDPPSISFKVAESSQW